MIPPGLFGYFGYIDAANRVVVERVTKQPTDSGRHHAADTGFRNTL